MHVMRTLILLLPVFIISTFSCKNEATQNQSANCVLSGRYFNRTVLDQCPEKMPSDIPHYALELAFFVKDSVDIFNGFEKYRLPVVARSNCQYSIVNATQFGDMLFEIKGDTILLLQDTAWTTISGASTFGRAHADSRKNWDFDNYFNDCLIAGTYSMKDSLGKTSLVYFLPNGQVSGISPFLSYKLCYAGDCLEETETPARIIEFTTDKGLNELFAIRMPAGKSLVQFFSIGDPVSDIKGQRKIGEPAFEITAGIPKE